MSAASGPGTAVVVVPVADAARMAAACVLVRVDATVVPLQGAGTGVVLGGGSARDAVQRLSKGLGQVEITLFERTADQVRAATWRAGQEVATPAAGVALSCVPDLAESLVLGADPLAQDGAVSTRGMSRVEAARTAMAGTGAEAAWAERLQRWQRVLALVVLAALGALVAVEVVRAAGGGGSPVVLGVAIALFGLLALREVRRRRPS